MPPATSPTFSSCVFRKPCRARTTFTCTSFSTRSRQVCSFTPKPAQMAAAVSHSTCTKHSADIPATSRFLLITHSTENCKHSVQKMGKYIFLFLKMERSLVGDDNHIYSYFKTDFQLLFFKRKLLLTWFQKISMQSFCISSYMFGKINVFSAQMENEA